MAPRTLSFTPPRLSVPASTASTEGQKVEYELVTDRKTGKMSADNLSLVN
jgi:hypothetical protein